MTTTATARLCTTYVRRTVGEPLHITCTVDAAVAPGVLLEPDDLIDVIGGALLVGAIRDDALARCATTTADALRSAGLEPIEVEVRQGTSSLVLVS